MSAGGTKLVASTLAGPTKAICTCCKGHFKAGLNWITQILLSYTPELRTLICFKMATNEKENQAQFQRWILAYEYEARISKMGLLRPV